MALALALGLGASLLGACHREGFHLTVTFPDSPPLEVGSLVRYQGVPVGGITEVTLVQGSPDQPGQVELGVVIDESEIVLRQGDVFEVASDGVTGDSYLRIIPAEQTSPPLAAGARVAGRPPLADRVVETTEEALARLGVLARKQADLLVESLSEQFEGRDLRPEHLDGREEAGAPPAPDGAAAETAPTR